MNKIKVTPEAFEYLFIQRGDISHIEDRAQWEIAYEAALYAQFASIYSHLPKLDWCNVLDIGGGMGGINILLRRFFGSADISIIDGLADPCVMRRHAETFNNATVGREFLKANEVESIEYLPTNTQLRGRPFGLVISFASYCFHYPPSVYVERIRQSINENTILIFDVRRDRLWTAQLQEAFGPGRVIVEGKKFQRMVFGGNAQ